MVAPGRLVHGMPATEYHAINACSYSALKVLRDKSPAHLKYRRDHPDIGDTPAMRLGRLVHEAVLEPESFATRYALVPSFDRRTTAGKTGYAEWIDAHPGVESIDPATWDTIEGIRAALARHPGAARVLTGEHEVSAFWTDEETGLDCKSRFDGLTGMGIGKRLVIDLKTTRDAAPDAFCRAIYEFAYYLQAAFYIDAAKACGAAAGGFAFIAVETAPPFGVAVYNLDPAAIEAGREQARALMRLYAKCLAADRWPGYFEKVSAISLPPWSWRQITTEV